MLVIDSNKDGRAASMGNMLVTRMMMRGARGVVTDGTFRDGVELSRMDFPIWSTGVTATTRLSYHHVADLQVPPQGLPRVSDALYFRLETLSDAWEALQRDRQAAFFLPDTPDDLMIELVVVRA